jgi:hypothetical protein
MNFWVGVYDPTGERICYSYTGAATLSINNCAITSNGQHTILVFDLNDDATGTYSLALSCVTGLCGPAPLLVPRAYLPLLRR